MYFRFYVKINVSLIFESALAHRTRGKVRQKGRSVGRMFVHGRGSPKSAGSGQQAEVHALSWGVSSPRGSDMQNVNARRVSSPVCAWAVPRLRPEASSLWARLSVDSNHDCQGE